MTSAANLTIVVDAINNANRTLQQVRADLQGIDAPARQASSSLGSLAGIARAGFAIQGAREAISVLKSTVSAASDASESLNKERVVFGAASTDIEQFARNSARDFGLSNQAALESTATFGNLFTAMGIGQPKAAEMSKTLIKLAADLASFNNISPEIALQKLQSGLVGEERPLRDLGVNLNAVAIQQKAVSLGLAQQGQELTAAQKAQAAYALILEQTTTAQGDFARTSGGLANQTRILNAEVQDLQAHLGKLAVPPLKISISGLNEVFRFMDFLDERAKTKENPFQRLSEGVSQFYSDIAKGDPSLRGFYTALTEGTKKSEAYAARLRQIGESEAADVAPTLELSGALSDLERHLTGLDTAQREAANKGSLLIASQIESIRATHDQAAATESAYVELAKSNNASDQAIVAAHNQEVADKAAAEAKRLQSEADAEYAKTVPGMVLALAKQADQTLKQAEANREYAAANGLLVDSASNLLPTMSELVAKTQDSYIATQRDTEARREAYAAMGLETDSMGNLIQTTEQLVRAQEDSINASIRQSNATLQVAQQDFPHLVQQERQSILASQAMQRATEEANKELVAEGLIADKTASSLNSLASAQYSVADYGTAALAPNFRPQDFQTIRGSPTVNGQSGGSSGGGAASTGGSVGGAQGGGSVAYYSSGYAAPRTTAVRQSVSSYSSRPASRSAASNVHNGTVINGNVYITTSANNFSGAFNRI